ncbi:MAG: bifunctional UDP-N-acetylmuramoyl-tripeptide:D-alanyl-D-alanine ligase/alanine racemase [Bacteroidota bacterium]|jgi:alanine racemase
MSYAIQEIAEIVQGKLVHQAAGLGIADRVEHLLIDSRKVVYPETSLFVAIKGERNDGHAYLKDVYDSGVRNFMLQQFTADALPADVNIILVPDALHALQTLAGYHRKHFAYPVVGITGSNGKTIVKEWLYQLLKDDVNVVRNPKSYNSQVGVPLSVWQMQGYHQLGIFEAGISIKGEMGKLEQMIKPDIGIFTYLGSAHDEGFYSRKEKLHEKLQLFKAAGLLIYSRDYEDVEEGVIQFLPRHPNLKTFTWSLSGIAADCNFQAEIKSGQTQIKWRRGSHVLSISIPFTDEASINNACSCFAFLAAVNRLSTDVLKRFEALQAIEMRLQLKEGNNNCILINDSYNADINALQIALDFMEQQSAGYQKTVILSDILQSGVSESDLYKQVAALLRHKNVSRIICIGPVMCRNKQVFDAHTQFYESTAQFIQHFKSLDYLHQIILIKGAREFRFEKISSLLEKRIHETIFEVNLNALVHNLNVYRKHIAPQVKLMGMVKAYSYGAGSYEIAKVLEFNRVDYLTVAYADEGVVLRKAGIKLPIMVMNPEASAFDQILKHNLEPEIYNFHILDQLINACDGEETGIHIELDCGMKRLGFDEDKLDLLIDTLKQNPNIRVRSVFAHLAASEEKKHDEFTHEQIYRFNQMSNQLMAAFDYPVLRHILNSSGIVRFPDAQFDMVRLGIGLYGIDPSGNMQKELQHIGVLKTVISQLRQIRSHETVGYSRKGKVTRDTMIATVAIGYADGLNRRLGNGRGYMLVNGKRAPVVGSICMDMTMLDVTDIACKEGDEVIVFGKEPGIMEIADKTGTIPYEVLTAISQRVKRVYFWE